MISTFAIKSCTNSLPLSHLYITLFTIHFLSFQYKLKTNQPFLHPRTYLSLTLFPTIVTTNNNTCNMTMGDHNNNWGTSEFNHHNHHHHHQVGLDVPKFKSAQPPSLPLSPSPPSPSSFLAFSSAFSPSEFLNSSLFFPSPNVSYKLSHANKLVWFGFMLWGMASLIVWFYLVFMCVVLDFCISYY